LKGSTHESDPHLILRVHDVAAAMPATVSCYGVSTLTPSQLGWRPLCISWLAAAAGEAAAAV
jgi:hypothetical protein